MKEGYKNGKDFVGKFKIIIGDDIDADLCKTINELGACRNSKNFQKSVKLHVDHVIRF